MAKCEVTSCDKEGKKAISIMGQKKWYCEEHFKSIFKELSSIGDEEENEDEEV